MNFFALQLLFFAFAQQRSFVPHPFELRLERPAGDDLDRLVAEIAPCGLFVETPRLALNGNLFHP